MVPKRLFPCDMYFFVVEKLLKLVFCCWFSKEANLWKQRMVRGDEEERDETGNEKPYHCRWEFGLDFVVEKLPPDADVLAGCLRVRRVSVGHLPRFGGTDEMDDSHVTSESIYHDIISKKNPVNYPPRTRFLVFLFITVGKQVGRSRLLWPSCCRWKVGDVLYLS